MPQKHILSFDDYFKQSSNKVNLKKLDSKLDDIPNESKGGIWIMDMSGIQIFQLFRCYALPF